MLHEHTLRMQKAALSALLNLTGAASKVRLRATTRDVPHFFTEMDKACPTQSPPLTALDSYDNIGGLG